MMAWVASAAVLGLGLASQAGPLRGGVVRDVNPDRARSGSTPMPPLHEVDLTLPRFVRRTLRVPAGGDLQRTLDLAMPGDRLELEAGATFHGPFRLPAKRGDEWIVVTSAPAADLPPIGSRAQPSHDHAMAKLRSSRGPVIAADRRAHHFRLVGLDIAPADGVRLTTLVELGDAETDVADQPHHIVLDRCVLRGDPERGARRGVAMNARYAAVIDSHLTEFKDPSDDAQAIAGWNGGGPFTIANNHLEASGENLLFGGADPSIHALVPSDIRVTGNYFTKPLGWKRDHPDCAGVRWLVKNVLELKNARRVVISGNVLEHAWADGQDGYAVLLTVRNQSGGAPWSVVEDVAFSDNLVRRVGGGVNLLGRDDSHPSEITRRVALRNNLFVDVGGRWGEGRLLQMLDGTEHVTVSRNTAIQSGSVVVAGERVPHRGFAFMQNIVRHNEFGIIGTGTASGRATLARHFPSAVVRENLFIGGSPGAYPTGNRFVGSLEQAGYTEDVDGRLQRIPNRDSAQDVGADVAAILEMARRVENPEANRIVTDRPSPGRRAAAHARVSRAGPRTGVSCDRAFSPRRGQRLTWRGREAMASRLRKEASVRGQGGF